MKICNVCGDKKPLSEFNNHARTNDKLQPACRKCDNARTNLWWKEITLVSDALKQRFVGRPCVDCHEVKRWCAMEFDHLLEGEERKSPWMKDENDFDMVFLTSLGEKRGKKINISQLGNLKLTPVNLLKTLLEIAATELICSNCHRYRTTDRRAAVKQTRPLLTARYET